MSKLHKLVATTAIVSTVAFGLAQVADADTYTVKKGDTLWDIAINNGTTVDQLMHDNNLTSSLIFPGDKLTYNTTVSQVAQAKQEGYYSVVLGDTLAKISSRFGVSVDELVKLNNISNPNLIYVGEVLRIDAAAAAKTQTTAATVAKASVTQTTSAQTVVKVDPTATVAAKPAATPAPAPAATPAPAAKPAATPAPAATTQVASSNKAAAIYQAAMAQLGRIQDCTMLVTNSLKAVGINFHDWPAGYMSLGTVVPASQAQPGDLVYYANGGLGFAHIAVYAGNGQAIHGGWNGNQTVVNSVNVGSGPVFIRVR